MLRVISGLRRIQKNYLSTNRFFMENTQPFKTGLKLRNSLTGNLEEFEPSSGNQVHWYTCGPTVYSHSHLGHARNYSCNDMIRRVLRDYLGYDVKLVMNITDIDDKIIAGSQASNTDFFQFAKKWQKDFFEDMKSLDVEQPQVLTRVTEYVPDIISFIKKIIENGYGYVSNGSVYFDIEKFKEKFAYGKLKRLEAAETEPEEEQGEKKSKFDFALWKKAKAGEPSWNSEWGEGRPGWHIECSAMASGIFGSQMDIHSGGVDLIFPHHENELAQSEAHYCQEHWVKYFLHVGHLHIDKLKMSKSLKNFITIKELLKNCTPRVLRLYFAMHQYDKTLNYSPENSLAESSEKDKKYKNFFSLLKSKVRDLSIESPQKWQQKDIDLSKLFDTKKSSIHSHLLNNFDTGSVFTEIDELVKATNTYLSTDDVKLLLLSSVGDYLLKLFKVLGMNYQEETNQTSDNEDKITDVLVKFRDRIRTNAKSDFKKILEICDQVREDDLTELGIRIMDKKIDEPSIWKKESKEVLLKEREDKLKAQKKKEEEAEKKLEKMKVDPRTMFRDDPRYVQFDENGVPTHEKDKDGNSKELSQKVKDKLKKQWVAQKQQFDKFQETLQK